MNRGVIRNAGCAVAVLLALGGCSAQPESVVCDKSGSGRIHGTPLREVMFELRHAVYEDQHLSELERDDLRRSYALNLADSVATLVKEVAAAPTTVPALCLNADDAAAYAAYTRELAKQGEVIRAVAEAYETEKIGEAVNAMIDVCNRCHGRFDVPFVCGKP